MIDLTPFDFTATESLVYEVLLTSGPGTGYAVARAAGLARANAYSALEGLVAKGAARSEGERPKRYRPEPGPVLLGRIAGRHGMAMDALAESLARIAVPSSPTLSEVGSVRALAQLLGLEIARAQARVDLAVTPDLYQLLGPALRRASVAGATLALWADGEVRLDAAAVGLLPSGSAWPGRPLLAAIDERTGLIGSMLEGHPVGHHGTAPAFVAAARMAIGALTGGPRSPQ